MIRRGKTAETLTFTMPDTAEDAALLQALNNAIDDISPDLKVTGIVDFDKEARIRRVNLLRYSPRRTRTSTRPRRRRERLVRSIPRL